MSTLIIELPTRENGGQLAPWDDLVSVCESARERVIATHLDGARLWEAAAGYDRSLDEICELFDSTYVSFSKGIGALPGALLLVVCLLGLVPRPIRALPSYLCDHTGYFA